MKHYLVSLFLLGAYISGAETPRPNVLFIAVDDLRTELGAYGCETIKSPNIDRLSAKGIRFDRAYCQQAVCGASRTSLMTGMYPQQTGVHRYTDKGWRKRLPDVVSLNECFQQAGYAVEGAGKIYHTNGWLEDGDIAHWDHFFEEPRDNYALATNNAIARAHCERKLKETGQPFGSGPTAEAAPVEDFCYRDGLVTRHGLDMIERLSGKEKPFFIAVGFRRPHLPFACPKKYWDLYDRETIPMATDLERPEGYPDWASNLTASEISIMYVDCPEGEVSADWPDSYKKLLKHGYYASVSYVDALIGQLIEKLDKEGCADNTIIVLWGDHGWKLGEHSSWVKHTNFEIDTRVPLIIYDPRAKTNATATDALVELVDLYPTLVERCGLTAPKTLRGKSFAKLLESPDAEHRPYALSQYLHREGALRRGYSIRTAQYRYTEWYNEKTGAFINACLSDLQADPGEQHNIIQDPVHAEGLAQCKYYMQEAIKAVNKK